MVNCVHHVVCHMANSFNETDVMCLASVSTRNMAAKVFGVRIVAALSKRLDLLRTWKNVWAWVAVLRVLPSNAFFSPFPRKPNPNNRTVFIC
jgi:hypothetical protein